MFSKEKVIDWHDYNKLEVGDQYFVSNNVSKLQDMCNSCNKGDVRTFKRLNDAGEAIDDRGEVWQYWYLFKIYDKIGTSNLTRDMDIKMEFMRIVNDYCEGIFTKNIPKRMSDLTTKTIASNYRNHLIKFIRYLEVDYFCYREEELNKMELSDLLETAIEMITTLFISLGASAECLVRKQFNVKEISAMNKMFR